jgi:hypothetical protein
VVLASPSAIMYTVISSGIHGVKLHGFEVARCLSKSPANRGLRNR